MDGAQWRLTLARKNEATVTNCSNKTAGITTLALCSLWCWRKNGPVFEDSVPSRPCCLGDWEAQICWRKCSWRQLREVKDSAAPFPVLPSSCLA